MELFKRMKDGTLRHYLEEFRLGRDVASAETEPLLNSLISETDETLLANILDAWCIKGTTEDELFEFASILPAAA